MASLENKSGKYVDPSPDSGALTFKGETLSPEFTMTVADPKDPGAYPISTLTYMLFYPTYQDADKAKALQSMVDWSLTDGAQFAKDLSYIPLESDIVTKVKDEVATISTK